MVVEGGTKKTSGIRNDSSTSRATTAALVISYNSFQMIPLNKVVETNLQLLRQPTGPSRWLSRARKYSPTNRKQLQWSCRSRKVTEILNNLSLINFSQVTKGTDYLSIISSWIKSSLQSFMTCGNWRASFYFLPSNTFTCCVVALLKLVDSMQRNKLVRWTVRRFSLMEQTLQPKLVLGKRWEIKSVEARRGD